MAAQKKREHIVDHVLFCLQMEDLIRAAQFQPQVLEQWAEQQAVSAGTDPAAESKWLMDMAQSLRDSGAVEHGHASDVRETLMELAHLHELLLGAMADAEYKSFLRQPSPCSKT